MKMIPVIKGRIGTTEYYVATMKAAEVVSTLRIPKEMPDWDKESLEERYQREINYKRVKQQIAPYLAEDPDRFFGSLIVDILDSDSIAFSSLNEAGLKVPKIFETAFQQFGEAIGLLSLSGNERLVPLDGQHRLAALRFAMNGKDEKDQPITTFQANDSIASDDITLILLKHDPIKARKIFNKVNRYAKATSKADNLITADDDVIAVISRKIANEDIGARLVNFDSNTLSANSPAFTTLATIYEASLNYLERSGIAHHKIDTTSLPDKALQSLWQQELERLWETLLNKVILWNDCVTDPSEQGDAKRIEIRSTYVIAKPVAQLSLVLAVARLVASGEATLDELAKRINQIDWRNDADHWQHVLMIGPKVVSGKQAVNFASRFIAYLLGERLEQVEWQQLEDQYKNQFPADLRAVKKLPPRAVN